MAQYADIISIDAPSEAASSSRVDLTIRVKNTYSAPIGMKVAATLEYDAPPYPGAVIPVDWVNVDAQATWPFSGYFYMPGQKLTVRAKSFWYGADGVWYADDEMTKTVNLASVGSPNISDFRIADFAKA
ncbi:hypothetical protein DEALK_06810 [Dehalogenimonas alkenigignens]|uniref:Uncharacterized protein n=1 Tax=Dehalogenimonas alkenigignens TaxID=1217799 RepID=A0A0W0GH19_9CHLR|nr:hypothetical protein [Dehalogenimonas alkenigignens]KTB47836.1 hypothetical protein DEALK_06810 [Dehalogenimonas alkenigignens]